MSENYDGEYKVELSDKGRVRFDLNWKWLLGISITILGFIGFLLIEKYYTQPLQELRIENIKLKQELKDERLLRIEDRKAIDMLNNNQGILLDRSERTQSFINDWLNKVNKVNNHVDNSALDRSDGPGLNK